MSMYDESDLKTIFSRAIQIQKQNDGIGSNEKLSLSEIEEIARESGLSAEYVREAAIELEGIPNEKPFFLETGKRHEIELLGYAKGTIDQKSWAELRSVIEEEFKSSGAVRRYPEGIQWTDKPTGIFNMFKSMNTKSVELQESGFRSIIKIKKRLKLYRRILYPAYGSLAGALMVFTLFLQNGEPGALVAIAALMGASKFFFKWGDFVREKSKSNLLDTMSRLQTIIHRKHKANERDTTIGGIELEERELDSGNFNRGNSKTEKQINRVMLK